MCSPIETAIFVGSWACFTCGRSLVLREWFTITGTEFGNCTIVQILKNRKCSYINPFPTFWNFLILVHIILWIMMFWTFYNVENVRFFFRTLSNKHTTTSHTIVLCSNKIDPSLWHYVYMRMGLFFMCIFHEKQDLLLRYCFLETQAQNTYFIHLKRTLFLSTAHFFQSIEVGEGG